MEPIYINSPVSSIDEAKEQSIEYMGAEFEVTVFDQDQNESIMIIQPVMDDFDSFISNLKALAKALGVDFSFDDPDRLEESVNLTFYEADELAADNFIRAFRNKFLKGFGVCDGNKIGYSYCVYKSFINSHKYWSVRFQLSEGYKMIEQGDC